MKGKEKIRIKKIITATTQNTSLNTIMAMKNKSQKAIIGIVSLTFVFLFCCIGKTDCPGYSREYLNWIPYSQRNYMNFSNGTDTGRFVIEKATYSDLYSFKNNCDCACEASAYFSTCIANGINLQIEGHSYYVNSSDINYEYNLIRHGYSGDYYVAENSDDFHFSKENGEISDKIISEFSVNNIVFKNVIKLELDTIDDNSALWRKPEIWRIFIADSIGIIQFEYCETGEIWKIINE
jgi:hypothetical protein